LRENLNGFLLKHDSKYEPQPFWERYPHRAELYKCRLTAGVGINAFEKMFSAFSGNIISRLDDWPALVSHHSANAAAAVLAELCGDGS
jgi:hypothetical protein